MTQEFNELVRNTYKSTVEYVQLVRMTHEQYGSTTMRNVTPQTFHNNTMLSLELCDKLKSWLRQSSANGLDVYEQQQVVRKYEEALEFIRTLDKEDAQYKDSRIEKVETILEDVKSSRIFNFRQVGEAQFQSSLGDISAKLIQVEQAYQEGKISAEKAKKLVTKLQNSHKAMANRVGDLNKESYNAMGKLLAQYSETYQKEPLTEQVTEEAKLDDEMHPDVIETMETSNKSMETFSTLLKLINQTNVRPIGVDTEDINTKMKKIMMMFEDRRLDWDMVGYEIRELYKMADMVKSHQDAVARDMERREQGLQVFEQYGQEMADKTESMTATSIYAQTLSEVAKLEEQIAGIQGISTSGQGYSDDIALSHLAFIQSQVRGYVNNVKMMQTTVHEPIPEELKTRITTLGSSVKQTAQDLGLLKL